LQCVRHHTNPSFLSIDIILQKVNENVKKNLFYPICVESKLCTNKSLLLQHIKIIGLIPKTVELVFEVIAVKNFKLSPFLALKFSDF